MSDPDHGQDRDQITGKSTTGHVWDGIKELNTPLPRWWLNVFYVCIVFSIVYYVFNPSWPYFDGDRWTATEGIADYSQRAVLEAELAEAEAARGAWDERMAALPIEEIFASEELRRIANQAGASHFQTNCAGCHGSGAQGFTGFPNLRDDYWLWGGTLQDIQYTLQHGIRWEADLDSRFSVMPAFLEDGILTEDQIGDVVHYVRKISDQSHEPARAEAGAAIFAEQCTVCHGDNAMGDRTFGAPNLTDAIWLYGGDIDTLTTTLKGGRKGVMPAWGNRLDPVAIKQLAIYVSLLGGGETKLADMDGTGERDPAGGP